MAARSPLHRQEPHMTENSETLLTRLEIEDAVVRMFVATDERDWPTLESCFTEPFVLDMTSLVGGTPLTMTPKQVAAAWAEGFKPLDHVHHQVGNFRTTINGNNALVRCYGVAFHHRTQVAQALKSRVFVGTYEIRLVKAAGRWLINELKFLLKFIDGNLELEKSA
jgi:hypothetical protein